MGRDGFRTWVLANVVPALTVAGLALYVMLRLPYAVYYGRLGTTPEDVGLGYIEMLAQSALGIGAIVFVAALGAVFVALLVIVAFAYAQTLPHILRNGLVPSWHTSDEAWPGLRTVMHKMLTRVYGASPEDAEAALVLADERRTLRRVDTPTEEQRLRLREVTAEQQAAHNAIVRTAGARLLRRVARVVVVVTAVAFVALPVGAWFEANRVRGCARPVSSAFFALRGASATVSRLTGDGTLLPVQGYRRLHYLGRTDKALVVYACDGDEEHDGDTIRVPPDGIVVVERTG